MQVTTLFTLLSVLAIGHGAPPGVTVGNIATVTVGTTTVATTTTAAGVGVGVTIGLGTTTTIPTTILPTTILPTTIIPTTIIPTTIIPTTIIPTTIIPTTIIPTTIIPTTVIPTTVIPTSVIPTTSTIPKFVVPTGWAIASAPCIADGSARVLAGTSTTSSSMTIEKCLAFCDAGGYAIAGVEYSTECYCGNLLTNGGSLLKTATCNMPCGGASYETCGGSYALSLFVSTKANAPPADLVTPAYTPPTGWVSTACIHEPAGARALIGYSFASDSMTIDMCIAGCAAKGFGLAGVEYGRECYCDNSLKNGASLTYTGTCNMGCAGSSGLICGGSYSINLYTNAALIAAGSFTPPVGWASIGCLKEPSGGRALAAYSYSSDSMTIEACISTCSTKGFAYAGVEYARECYCDSQLRNGASATNTATCNMPCSGAAGETCGGEIWLRILLKKGSYAINVYNNPAISSAQPISNGLTFSGCLQEVQGRALTGAVMVSDSLTVDMCTGYCKNAGFKYAAVEYARECYCGNSLVNGASLTLTSNQCNMVCSSGTGLCGGPNALAIYM